ncbi:MAG: hypothetical protein A2X56_13395 [Nitrospirae bacterium GWC2_57_13]|nr:MAG: hypothetical protein A2072_08885 [Nitrospirae bacterium GWC1_57_7]OGW27015.1 MAG: hypothetical protein A2X56_13395 [Nitrospirae bacterium GWC2_57_13]OGW42593.1 MAG: hypothetical protein A2X57_11835 [Nitrospirae bacterium GWD2_57_8]HAR44740.1 hypothetical protein [Nitrospiraceae bacterium]HAS53252.1 hypothetical protein [Nitrospiraceae bacterium]
MMLDYLGIFKRFNEEGIRYIVVGGMAVNLHGIPRMTYDIDLLLDMDDRNIESFIQLLTGWGFKPKVPVDIAEFADSAKRNDWIKNKNMKAFNLMNPEWAIREIDILIDAPVDFAKADRGKKVVLIQNVQVPVIGIDDLIVMKEKADRQQDAADVRSLKELRDE